MAFIAFMDGILTYLSQIKYLLIWDCVNGCWMSEQQLIVLWINGKLSYPSKHGIKDVKRKWWWWWCLV